MHRASFLAAIAALLALALPASACAYAHPTVTTMRLAVEITGVHVVDWRYQSTDDLAAAEVWTAGSGTQTLGFSTPKPLPYRAIVSRGKLPNGQSLAPLRLQPLSSKPLKGSLRRSGSFRYKAPPPCGEGECSGGAPVQRTETGSCPAKRRGVPVGLDTSSPEVFQGRPTLDAFFGMVEDVESPWADCPPDVNGSRNNLRLAQPRAVFLPGGLERIVKLRRGAKLTLKGDYEISSSPAGEKKGKCPPLKGEGMSQCAVTDITVEVTRVR
jgi:hypothetical protein